VAETAGVAAVRPAFAASDAAKEKKVAKSQRRGNKEERKPNATKPQLAALATPFDLGRASISISPPKRKG